MRVRRVRRDRRRPPSRRQRPALLRRASVAGNLYGDVGEVAMTLINLRLKQAEAILKFIDTIR